MKPTHLVLSVALLAALAIGALILSTPADGPADAGLLGWLGLLGLLGLARRTGSRGGAIVLFACLPALATAQSMADQQAALFERLEVEAGREIVGSAERVAIGIIDSGFDFDHPDLRGQLRPGFYAPWAQHPQIVENIAHGTMVSGLIVARDDGLGMTGLAPGCPAIAAAYGTIDHDLLRLQRRFFSDHPEATADDWMAEMNEHRRELLEFSERWSAHVARSTAAAVRWLVDEGGVRVINISAFLSRQSLGEHADVVEAAFAHAARRDVLIVLGAGNHAALVTDYVGDERSVVVAGASLLDGDRWVQQVEFRGRSIEQGSCHGPRLTVMAPVDQLVVCRPHESRFHSSDDGPFGPTGSPFEGPWQITPCGATSAAAPIVSALAALVRSLRPDLDAAEVVALLGEGADDLGRPGRDPLTGHGRINFRRTLERARDRPSRTGQR